MTQVTGLKAARGTHQNMSMTTSTVPLSRTYMSEVVTDERDGRHDGVGRGRLLMLLKSEINSGVVGRSTYFTHHYHVDDQNTHRHDDKEQDKINA